MGTCPSGRNLEISWGDQRAVVVEVGGGIRCYEVDDRPILDPYPIECMGEGGTALRSSPCPTAWPTGSTALTTNTSCSPTPNWSTTPPATFASHPSSVRRHWSSSSPTSPGPHTAGTGPTLGGPVDERSQSGRRTATGSPSSMSGDPGRSWHHQESHSGLCDDRCGRPLVHHHSRRDRILRESGLDNPHERQGAQLPMRQEILGMGTARAHCPGTAHLVVSGTCSPPREATSADQRVLAAVSR